MKQSYYKVKYKIEKEQYHIKGVRTLSMSEIKKYELSKKEINILEKDNFYWTNRNLIYITDKLEHDKYWDEFSSDFRKNFCKKNLNTFLRKKKLEKL